MKTWKRNQGEHGFDVQAQYGALHAAGLCSAILGLPWEARAHGDKEDLSESVPWGLITVT